MFLEKMAAWKREEVDKRKKNTSLQEMQKKASNLPVPRGFLQAILSGGPMALIAEIKRASPSAGMIRQDINVQEMARKYQLGGASAISVLTEERFFHGALRHIALVKEAVSLPILQKDFIVDSFQIYEGKITGADALLLIAAILDQKELKELAELSQVLGMFPLVEIHDERDLGKTPGLNLPLLGINNRNLKTLEVDLENTFRLIEKIPSGTVVISESGIKTGGDMKRLQKAGVKGALIGEVLMRAPDPVAKIREFLK
jgi:indole-3-glycerol phosphate synthase